MTLDGISFARFNDRAAEKDQTALSCSTHFTNIIFVVANGRIQVNPLPDDTISGLPKLKAFANDKSNVTQNIKVVFHRIENIAGKEENAGHQHFLLFPQCFPRAFFLQRVKSRHCVVMG